MSLTDDKLTRIGVFYDGNYFSKVSDYYRYHYLRQARLSITGLHRFIRSEVAKDEGVDQRYCQIVDMHYFRGRLSATEAKQRNLLFSERQFDDVLMREGIVTHYLPMTPNGEKGIDVWLALEVLELAVYKRFNVCVLVTGDRDFVPLVRKLNTLGTRVMLLGWSFAFDEGGETRWTETSQHLINEATYPILMNEVIDDRTRKDDPLISGLFLPPKPETRPGTVEPNVEPMGGAAQADGMICSLRGGYGFIKSDVNPVNFFFYHADVRNRDFSDLRIGDNVRFEIGVNDDGGPVAKNIEVRGDQPGNAGAAVTSTQP